MLRESGVCGPRSGKSRPPVRCPSLCQGAHTGCPSVCPGCGHNAAGDRGGLLFRRLEAQGQGAGASASGGLNIRIGRDSDLQPVASCHVSTRAGCTPCSVRRLFHPLPILLSFDVVFQPQWHPVFVCYERRAALRLDSQAFRRVPRASGTHLAPAARTRSSQARFLSGGVRSQTSFSAIGILIVVDDVCYKY